jgi:hypothetical protein
MDVQKQNRQETIINHDASIFLDAIRNGEMGLDDLTNYVISITSYSGEYYGGRPSLHTTVYTYTNSIRDGSPTTPQVPLTNGFNIIGLLSTPKYIWTNSPRVGPGLISNYVVAYFRSMSGPASEKFPQYNTDVRDLSLTYRMVSEVIPTSSWDNDWTNYVYYVLHGTTNDWSWRSNYFNVAKALHADLNEVRLTFRWPYFTGSGAIGNGRQVYRTTAGGYIQAYPQANPPSLATTLYFVQPRNFITAP